mgnify:CR=1 FL=1
MAIEFKKKAIPGKTPVIWRGECKILPGGFKPKQSFPIGTVLRRGIPIFVDYDDMSAAVCKVAKVLKGGTTVAPRVAKGHYFAQGDVIMKEDVTDKSPAIKSIDTSNADYDVLTLQSAIAGLDENDTLMEASVYVPAEGENEAVYAAPLYIPNMVIGADLEFKGTGIPTIDAAYEAMILYNHVPYPIPASWMNETKGSPCLKSNPNIMFIKQ